MFHFCLGYSSFSNRIQLLSHTHTQTNVTILIDNDNNLKNMENLHLYTKFRNK